MSTQDNDERKLCLALDGMTADQALNLLSVLGGRSFATKIHALLDEEGPEIIGDLLDYGAVRVWVDYKLHDTKDTVGQRVSALCGHRVGYITVHASGGVSMMQEAVKAAAGRAEIWAITVLTSLDDEEIRTIYGRERVDVVTVLAHLAKDAGVSGLVCSAQEVSMLRQDPYLVGLKLVVPGTRSSGVALGQQKRSGTPRQAIVDGATLLVAGSQVTKSTDPLGAFDAMEAEIQNA